MRLQSFLSRAGIASRRSVLECLNEGKVKVNGEVVRIPSFPIFEGKDLVTIDGKEVKISNVRYYFMFHKPRGVISTVRDTHGRKTVLDFFSGMEGRLYPAGRLDQDTTGLLIVTNDGELTNRLTHPRYGVEKVYEAVVSGEVGESQIRQLEEGVVIEGWKTSPCKIKVLDTAEGKSRVEISLHEGHKRQIRHMFYAVGLTVLELHRKQYGPLVLQDLKPGEKRVLTESEIQALKAAAQTQSRLPSDSPGPERPFHSAYGRGGRGRNFSGRHSSHPRRPYRSDR